MVVHVKKDGFPSCIIDIKKIAELHFLKKDKQGIWIGSLCSHSEIERSELIRREIDFLAHACSQIGSVQIRNRGTIGGNLCNASPAADTAAPLIVLDAILTVNGSNGDRSVSINDFFKDGGKNCLSPEEIQCENEPEEEEYHDLINEGRTLMEKMKLDVRDRRIIEDRVIEKKPRKKSEKIMV